MNLIIIINFLQKVLKCHQIIFVMDMPVLIQNLEKKKYFHQELVDYLNKHSKQKYDYIIKSNLNENFTLKYVMKYFYLDYY